MMNKTKKFYLALVIFSLVGQVAWVVENMYLNVFIYKMFNASAEAISTMVAASAVAATVTTLIIGALSDKLGKRKIFICGGYILWGISIWSFALIRMDVINALFPMAASAASLGVSLVIIMDCVMTFFGSSANDACFNAWLTDSTDSTNRGSVEGINAMMPLVAILVVFGGFLGVNQALQESGRKLLCQYFLRLPSQRNEKQCSAVCYADRAGTVQYFYFHLYAVSDFVLYGNTADG